MFNTSNFNSKEIKTEIVVYFLIIWSQTSWMSLVYIKNWSTVLGVPINLGRIICLHATHPLSARPFLPASHHVPALRPTFVPILFLLYLFPILYPVSLLPLFQTLYPPPVFSQPSFPHISSPLPVIRPLLPVLSPPLPAFYSILYPISLLSLSTTTPVTTPVPASSLLYPLPYPLSFSRH